jgi:phospholipase C
MIWRIDAPRVLLAGVLAGLSACGSENAAPRDGADAADDAQGNQALDAGGDGLRSDADHRTDEDGSAPSLDGAASDGGGSDAASEAGTCSTAFKDTRAQDRAACAFAAGAKVASTLDLGAAERAAIPIQHVVVLMKENRSFDELLGALHTSGQPETEAIPPSFANLDKSQVSVTSFHETSTCVAYDPGHQWDEMHVQVNGGKMDGFVVSAADTTGSDGHFAMGYYDGNDLPFYYWLASTYALNDRHFASARSGTFPNRNFLLLGTADGVSCTGCGYPDPATPTVMDALDKAGVTWGVYSDGSLLSGALNWNYSHQGAHHFGDFLTALHDGTLPQVAFVDSIDYVEDEHPKGDLQVGEAWTRNVYRAALASPLWPHMAMVWTYDEAGGFADHVAPPNEACIARPVAKDQGYVELGARVPLVVISPYARPHHVSHVVEEHTAITRFIETVFDLPALTARDANSPALLDLFDFGCPPALLAPPPAPNSGTGGCTGSVILSVDKPTYAPGEAIHVSWMGGPGNDPLDWIAVYPSGQTPHSPSTAWAYIGGGHTGSTSPASGMVTLDMSSVNQMADWPLAAGGWIAYYLRSDGYTSAGSVVFTVQ